MRVYIFDYSLFLKIGQIGYYWFEMVQFGFFSLKTQNRKMAKLVKKLFWVNVLIFEYIQIFGTNILIFQNIRKFLKRNFICIFICDLFILQNIFGYSFVKYLW